MPSHPLGHSCCPRRAAVGETRRGGAALVRPFAAAGGTAPLARAVPHLRPATVFSFAQGFVLTHTATREHDHPAGATRAADRAHQLRTALTHYIRDPPHTTPHTPAPMARVQRPRCARCTPRSATALCRAAATRPPGHMCVGRCIPPGGRGREGGEGLGVPIGLAAARGYATPATTQTD